MTVSDSSKRVCSVDGCEDKHEARGYCHKHHRRFNRHGDPHKLGKRPNKPPDMPLSELLWMQVEIIPDAESCWEWFGARMPKGYGKLQWQGRDLLAHRAVYEAIAGRIPDGEVVRHRCDNPPCCRPDHLRIGTYADNSRDMVERGRHNPNGWIADIDVLTMRQRYAVGESKGQLAKAYSVSGRHVHQLVTGGRRGDLPGAAPEIAAQRVGEWRERIRYGKAEIQQS